jgi:archaellum component FlaC
MYIWLTSGSSNTLNNRIISSNMDNLSHDPDPMSDGEVHYLLQNPIDSELRHVIMRVTAAQRQAENTRPSGSAPAVPTFPTAPTKPVSKSELEARYEALKRERLQHRIDALEKERQFDEREAEIQLAAASLMVEGQISDLKTVVDENEKSRKKDRADFEKLSATVKRLQAKVDALTTSSKPSLRQPTVGPQTRTCNVQDEIEGIRLEAGSLGWKLQVLRRDVTRPGSRHVVEIGMFKNRAEAWKNEVEALKTRLDSLDAEVARLSLTSTSLNLDLHGYFRHATKELRATNIADLDNMATTHFRELDELINTLPRA